MSPTEKENTSDQIERIQRMEACMDAAEQAMGQLSEALTAFEAVQPQYNELRSYYGSDLWMQDYEDDEGGRLPRELKRGVLSQDGVYDLICENRELLVRMLRLITGALESDGL